MWDYIGDPDARPTWMQGWWEGFAAGAIVSGAVTIMIYLATLKS